jgi:hypothetical protein
VKRLSFHPPPLTAEGKFNGLSLDDTRLQRAAANAHTYVAAVGDFFLPMYPIGDMS